MLELTAGAAILVLVVADFLETTLGAQGAGPITRFIYRGAFGLARHVRGPARRWVHRYAGPAILTTVASTWLGLHWLAWTLLFMSDPQSVLVSDTGEPAGWLETAAYVGAMLSTLGASRAEAGTALWDVASALAAVNGMVVLTLSVTFVVNITRTVTQGRAFALLFDTHDPRNPDHVELLRRELASVVAQFAAYPLAHSFSSARPDRRVVPAVAAFVERVVDEETLPTFRPILEMLPDVDASGDVAAVKRSVSRWAERFTIGDHRQR